MNSFLQGSRILVTSAACGISGVGVPQDSASNFCFCCLIFRTASQINVSLLMAG
jgi:hypothetical protein